MVWAGCNKYYAALPDTNLCVSHTTDQPIVMVCSGVIAQLVVFGFASQILVSYVMILYVGVCMYVCVLCMLKITEGIKKGN
jgi:hypothetical protein